MRLILFTPESIVKIPRAVAVMRMRSPRGLERTRVRIVKRVIIEIEMYL